ncbi:hypothetical protein SAMN03159338_1625 [Sphingomonas sp. NFR04]|jgi:hypothetical protein|uniref:hypothetical protein n=1 Tax=Sphingomonas sp. NFR04 TaxID=1566283 RepID=UPI0008EED92E|nr:hypothetical protein [Sphingomonas sp. NFR04]SFJ51480.1 hypothetical protein SAMN03159338_1625 [Sphingomonas sp. NFR04]
MADLWSLIPFRRMLPGETLRYERQHSLPESLDAALPDETVPGSVAELEELRGQLRDARSTIDVLQGCLRSQRGQLITARADAADVSVRLGVAQLEATGLQETNTALSESLAAVTAALEELAQTETAARAFMDVLAIRGSGGIPLFRANDDAAPADIQMLKHAVLTLQARLEGAPLPELVTLDRVLN